MQKRYKGRHRRPTQNRAVAAMSRPAVILAATVTISSGVMAPALADTADHTVRSGDTLSKLAATHGTPWRTIYADNREVIGANPNLLRIGQRLVVDGPSPASVSRRAPERASRAERPPRQVAAAPTVAPSGRPTPSSSSYSMWDRHVRPVVAEVTGRFGVSTVVTRAGHSPTQGRAADFMVYSDRAEGDAVAQYVIDNAARFRVDYVIWRQRVAGPWTGWAWRAMGDRGSPTANHMDHPHVSFLPAR